MSGVVSVATHPPFVRRPAARISARFFDCPLEDARELVRMNVPQGMDIVRQARMASITEPGVGYTTREVRVRKLGAYLVGTADTDGRDLAASRRQLDRYVERQLAMLAHPDGYPTEGRRVLPFDVVLVTGMEVHTRARECGWTANGTYTPPRYHVGPLVGEQERRVPRG